MTPTGSIAYVVDPRLPGGTSSAVAAELLALAEIAPVRVHALETRMFRGRAVAPQLAAALETLGLDLVWNAPTVSADLVVFHNPAVLKFQRDPGVRIVTRHLIVVTHENFLRPGAAEAFDVAGCLGQLDRATLSPLKSLAPVSPHNRQCILDWLDRNPGRDGWSVLGQDWFNICDHPRSVPSPAPADRRGRHSRPGAEKFPPLAVMDLCFPAHAQANVILGADSYVAAGLDRPHWSLYPFRGLDLDEYFAMVDFMVYFTAPGWRESFGRVMAEAIAAGKPVITDADTAAAFDGAALVASPEEVDAVIARLVGRPRLYRDHVIAAQARLDRHSSAAFREAFLRAAGPAIGVAP
ncbi:MAG: glycosyltransferase [Proteobacteria bacterium]|nr:glycosyltransferase [Pseudomonadota bacterium]MBS0573475.1 glycosyltransferase [Pseudomonadota bacterium]